MEEKQQHREEQIRQLAYRLWQEEGCPNGRDVEHWLRAQEIWAQMNRLQGKPKRSGAFKGRKAKQAVMLN